MPRPIELGRAVESRDGPGVARADAVEDDRLAEYDSGRGADSADGLFAHQGAEMTAR
jgi:hypothetical protein